MRGKMVKRVKKLQRHELDKITILGFRLIGSEELVSSVPRPLSSSPSPSSSTPSSSISPSVAVIRLSSCRRRHQPPSSIAGRERKRTSSPATTTGAPSSVALLRRLRARRDSETLSRQSRTWCGTRQHGRANHVDDGSGVEQGTCEEVIRGRFAPSQEPRAHR